MFTNMNAMASCIELQDQLLAYINATTGPSHSGLGIVRSFINEYQNAQPTPWFMTEQNAEAYFYNREHFLEVLDGINRPITNLLVLHQTLFPVREEGFWIYYTSQQVDTLARALMEKLLRLICSPGYVLLRKPTQEVLLPEQVAPRDAPIDTALVHDVLTIQANIQAERVTQIKPTDYRALIDATCDLADTLELRGQCNPGFMPDGGFFRSPEDVMFDHELETAMARSQGRVLTSQSDRELAKALALSQAMDEEQQFERDMALAMAMSTVENGTGDQELDSLLGSVMPKW
jgi:hypothetical protein